VIIPYHNGEDVISACLRSLASAATSPVRCTVVDNSPREGALATLAAPFPQVDILRLPGPVGFGKAANAGAKRAVAAGADYLVILNQDTRLGPGAIDALIAALQRHPACGLAAPLNWALDTGEIEPGFLRSYLAFCPGLVGDALRGTCRELYEVDFVLGACLALSAEDYRRLGLFDPIYHMYKEDDDLCRRFRPSHLRPHRAPEQPSGARSGLEAPTHHAAVVPTLLPQGRGVAGPGTGRTAAPDYPAGLRRGPRPSSIP
jgi:GT2 family glycosyltransferase